MAEQTPSPKPKKQRLDLLLVEQGLAPTREQAAQDAASSGEAPVAISPPMPSEQPSLARTAEEALEQLPEITVDLAIVDVSLPGTNGIELVAAIRAQYSSLRCIVLSGHHEHVYVRRALAAGAQGYVLKEHPLDLIAAVRAVLAGETYLSAELKP